MTITQAMCSSFKKELLEGVHNFKNGQDTFKLALYFGPSQEFLDKHLVDHYSEKLPMNLSSIV